MKYFSGAVKWFLLFCSVSGYSETEISSFFPNAGNAETVVSEVLYETEAEFFFFRKRCTLFGDNPDVEKAIDGWRMYKSVFDDLTVFQKEEEIRKREQEKKEEDFLKEVSRLKEIYRRKKEPVQKALDAWNRQPGSPQKEIEVSALENRLKEFDELCAVEIKNEKEKLFSHDGLSDKIDSPEEAAKKRVISKYNLKNSSFDGMNLSLSDIENSVISSRIVFSKVPEKNLIYSFDYGEKNETPILRGIKADYTGSGTEADLPELNKAFRFETNLLFNLLSECDRNPENFPTAQKSLPAQTISYSVGFGEISGKELGIGSLRYRKQRFSFPVSFSKKRGVVEIKSCLHNGNIYDFIFPENQKGSPAEYICLILRRSQTEALKEILQQNVQKKEIIKNPDFLSFDPKIPTEIFKEKPGYKISEEIGKNIGNIF